MFKAFTILIVEDEAPIRQMLSFALTRAGYKIMEASSISEAWSCLNVQKPSLILLDWMLPDTTGVAFLSKLRKHEQYSTLPVIMLTARAEESSKLRGFDVGADDYVTKPFSPKELLARINVLLRRSSHFNQSEERVSAGGIVLNISAHQLTINGVELKIGPLEFKLLAYLMTHPNKVLSRSILLSNVWDARKEISERTVDVHIRRVRSILEASKHDHHIQSIRGVGYKFIKE
jgi:two-component system, OmpR family, phosphate regulon response regulator PhoB